MTNVQIYFVVTLLVQLVCSSWTTRKIPLNILEVCNKRFRIVRLDGEREKSSERRRSTCPTDASRHIDIIFTQSWCVGISSKDWDGSKYDDDGGDLFGSLTLETSIYSSIQLLLLKLVIIRSHSLPFAATRCHPNGSECAFSPLAFCLIQLAKSCSFSVPSINDHTSLALISESMRCSALPQAVIFYINSSRSPWQRAVKCSRSRSSWASFPLAHERERELYSPRCFISMPLKFGVSLDFRHFSTSAS